MDDKAALKEIRKGGKKGFPILYSRYARSLRYQLITKYHIPEGSVDDVLQEIFVKFFKSIDTFKQDCSVSTWLYWIGQSVAIDYWRQQSQKGYPKNKTDENQDGIDETRAQQQGFKAQPPRTVSLNPFESETEEGSIQNQEIKALLDEKSKEAFQKAHNDLDIQMCFERALAQLERDASKDSLLQCLKALTFQAQGASIKDIAQEVGKTSEATRRYLSDCRRKLKQYQPIQRCRELLNKY